MNPERNRPAPRSRTDWLRLHALYAATMEAFEDVDSSPELIARSIEQILPEMHKPDAAAAKDAFDYWRGAFGAVRAATTRTAVKDIVRTYVCTANRHACSHFNIAQGLMKATMHTVWRKLYELEAGQLRTDPREAVRDAMMPPLARGQEFMQVIVTEIAAETGETAAQLIARVADEVGDGAVGEVGDGAVGGDSDDDSGSDGDDDSGSDGDGGSGSGSDGDDDSGDAAAGKAAGDPSV